MRGSFRRSFKFGSEFLYAEGLANKAIGAEVVPNYCDFIKNGT